MSYSNATFEPTVGDSYGHGWRNLWKNFLELLLIGIIAVLLGAPIGGISFMTASTGMVENYPAVFILPALIYGLLVMAPVSFGVYYAFLKAMRGQKVEIKDMFVGFSNIYGNVILAYILVQIIVGIGFVLLIIPGIIFACKLAFVPYLVVDKRLEAMEALKTSWKMTDGYAMNIFLLGLLGVLVYIGGMIVFFVGIIISLMWIYSALASMYYAVDTRLNPVEGPASDNEAAGAAKPEDAE